MRSRQTNDRLQVAGRASHDASTTVDSVEGTKNVSDNINGVKADAADNVKQASETLETQSRQLGQQVSDFLGKIRAA
ncbi:hypothetical protein ACRQ5Q_37285 [Bradyrhizobium sp. PMVTL-01]|uniref:hypothetical protein n=1 Tax=Bradyrhizobium sp. PMVTL-01 TaxID=3434999 RepID=UPI003F6F7E88